MRRWLSFAAVLALLAAFLVAPSASTQEQTIVIGTTDRITNLSTANSYDYWTWNTFQQTSEGLLELPPGSTEVAPALAESWAVSNGGKTYTFTLRKGVTYTDGTGFNCKTMAWTLARNIRLNGPEGGVGLIGMIDSLECPPATLDVALGEEPSFEELEAFLDAEVQDPYQLVINISSPDATFLARMAGTIGPSVALSPASTPGDDFAEGQYAGTGPYKLVRYEPEVETVFEAYENYWREGLPKTPKIITRFYADAAALRLAVESGEVDVGYRTFLPADILDLKARAESLGLQFVQGPSLSVRYVVFNVTAEPFDDVLVRRAISYAIDRGRIVQDIFFGLNDPLYSMVPAGLWSHIDAFPERDLGQARVLLQQAGYSEESPLEITLWFSPLHYGTEEADVATVLKDSLEATGMIEVELQSLEWGAYTTAMSQGELGMFLLGWYPDFIDPDNFLAPWLTESPEGLGTFLNQATSDYDQQVYQQFVELLGEAKRVTVQSARAGFYEEAQRLLAESVVMLPLWQNNSQAVAIAKQSVQGIVLDASMIFRTWLLEK